MLFNLIEDYKPSTFGIGLFMLVLYRNNHLTPLAFNSLKDFLKVIRANLIPNPADFVKKGFLFLLTRFFGKLFPAKPAQCSAGKGMVLPDILEQGFHEL